MMKKILRGAIRLVLKPTFHPRVPVRLQRWALMPLGPTQPHVWGSSFERINLCGVPGRRIATQPSTQRAVLYMHGGAFVTGSTVSHRGLMSHIAKAADATVYAPDYRLVPEHPHPAALEDALASYQAIQEAGHAPDKIFIAGDSAGGCLALLTALAIRDRGLPQPAGLVLISALTDLSQSGDSTRSKAAVDPMISPAWGHWANPLFAGENALDDPAVSPLFAGLQGLPPMLIQVASDEVLLDDSRRLADKARAAGVSVQFELYEGLWHVFQLHTKLMKESMQAIEQIGRFMKSA